MPPLLGHVRWLICVALVATRLHAQQVNPPTGGTGTRPPAGSAWHPDLGEVSDGVYRNRFCGFVFRLPYGWVDRTDDMRRNAGAPEESSPGKSAVLLAIFERPPEASEDGINAGVIIAAETTSQYPGLKDASQYFQPLAEIAKSKDLKPVNEPYDFPVDGMPIVRQDFSKKMANATVHQSTLVMLQKEYVVSFTFIGNSDDEITNLFDDLTFEKIKNSARKSHPR